MRSTNKYFWISLSVCLLGILIKDLTYDGMPVKSLNNLCYFVVGVACCNMFWIKRTLKKEQKAE